ncbi:MAG: NAD(P)/FAD-dependent oxidoreductase [Candidatus Thermoplasmatota archaeon]|jgi:geranylgeranyl reductase family protein|nr:NAD(P)/FAD-dependent oxidoreductase [Candidatus Thermoplasmatota archaeon]
MRYDVAIVGAGPAGATAAKILSEQNIHTILLDKASFPRQKPCGGGLQMRVLHRFKYLEEHDLIDSYSTAFQIHTSTLRHQIDFHHTRPLQAMVLRKTFDEGLVALAQRNGAFLQIGITVRDLTTDNNTIRVVLSDGTTIETSIVIGADGIWSTIAKKIGMIQRCDHIGVCLFAEYPMKQQTIQKLYGEERGVHIHLQPNGLAGYGWVFPKKEHVNIGVVEFRQALNPFMEKKNLQKNFADYLRSLKQQKLLPTTLPKTIPHGGAFPTCPMKQLTADRVMLCGDAGGLTNPMTGEGIFYAMCSGEMAAHTAIKALENNTFDASSLRRYQRIWDHEFCKDFRLMHRLSKRWGKNIDHLIQIASGDKKLMNIICEAIPKPGGVQQDKWKILFRFLYASCKNRVQ